MHKVRITAMRQSVYTDLMAQYENPIEHACDVQVGASWVSDGWNRPDGLCEAPGRACPPLCGRWARAAATSMTGG